MSQISELEAQLSAAFDRLRGAVGSGDTEGATAGLRKRIAELEAENGALTDELERLRDKRDKDVAALDDLIAQLKPLIEEVGDA